MRIDGQESGVAAINKGKDEEIGHELHNLPMAF